MDKCSRDLNSIKKHFKKLINENKHIISLLTIENLRYIKLLRDLK